MSRAKAPRGEGEQRIVEAATAFFAEEGFRAPTRDLAKRMGVSQALIYRYFRSKRALIDRVFADIVSRPGQDDAAARLLETDRPLRDRLTKFYQAIMARRSRQGTRLFMRAGLDDQKLAARYTFPLNQHVLNPVIAALRQEAGLPPPGRKPVMRAERELVMMLHGALAHVGIRKHIYESPLPDDLSDHVAFNVSCFLDGAVPTIRRLHKQPPRGALGVRLGQRKDSPIE